MISLKQLRFIAALWPIFIHDKRLFSLAIKYQQALSSIVNKICSRLQFIDSFLPSSSLMTLSVIRQLAKI